MIKYPASYTRMRALKGRLLKKDYLTGLLQMSDIHSISSALDDTVYGEQIRHAEDLNQIEHGLKQDTGFSERATGPIPGSLIG